MIILVLMTSFRFLKKPLNSVLLETDRPVSQQYDPKIPIDESRAGHSRAVLFFTRFGSKPSKSLRIPLRAKLGILWNHLQKYADVGSGLGGFTRFWPNSFKSLRITLSERSKSSEIQVPGRRGMPSDHFSRVDHGSTTGRPRAQSDPP